MGVKLSRLIAVSPSWPGLSRPSTPYFAAVPEDVEGRDKPGHDGETVVRPLNLTPMGRCPLEPRQGRRPWDPFFVWMWEGAEAAREYARARHGPLPYPNRVDSKGSAFGGGPGGTAPLVFLGARCQSA